MIAMKKVFHKTLKVLILAIVLLPAFTACNNDDDPVSPEEGPIKLNDFEGFQSCIIRTDSLGNFLSRSYGEPLLENDSTILYIGVDDIEEAKDMFDIWMPHGVETYSTGLSDNLSAVFTDKNDKRQGEIYFTAAVDDYIAEVTFSPELTPKHFSRIRFISNQHWPDAEVSSVFRLGDITLEYSNFDKAYLKAICIQEKSNGVAGLLISFTETKDNFSSFSNRAETPGVNRAHGIHKLLKRDFNFFSESFKKAGKKFNPDQWFWTCTYDRVIIIDKQYTINYKTNSTEWWSSAKDWKYPALYFWEF